VDAEEGVAKGGLLPVEVEVAEVPGEAVVEALVVEAE
jgi:hypothetical protein